jgi:hypothetical protein
MSKIFVRHRRHVGQGAGRPRFAVVAAQGADLNVYKTRVRRAELEKIAAEVGAEIVYLPRGEQAEEPEGESGKGRRRRRREQDED